MSNNLNLGTVKNLIDGILDRKNTRFKYLKKEVRLQFYKNWLKLAEEGVKIGKYRLKLIEESQELIKIPENFEKEEESPPK